MRLRRTSVRATRWTGILALPQRALGEEPKQFGGPRTQILSPLPCFLGQCHGVPRSITVSGETRKFGAHIARVFFSIAARAKAGGPRLCCQLTGAVNGTSIGDYGRLRHGARQIIRWGERGVVLAYEKAVLHASAHTFLLSAAIHQ